LANPILHGEWKQSMSMKDLAKLSYCIIKYIEDVEPHGSVGVGGNEPHIRYLPHGANSDIEPTKKEWMEFRESLPECISDFRERYTDK